MRNKVILLLVFEIIFLNCWSQKTENQGSLYLEEHQFEKAVSFFRDKVKKTPEDIFSLIGFGDALLASNKTDSARILFQKATALDSKNPFALVGLGKVALLCNDRIGESEYFDRARRADKLNPEVYSAVAEGCINLSKKDTITAGLFINQGLNINAKYAKLHLITGNLELLKKNWGLAANAYDRAIFFDPKSAIAWRNRGYIDLLSHTWKDALTAFNKSIALRKDQVLVYKYLGDLYYATAKYPEAEQAYKTYLSRTKPNSDEKERFAIVLFFNKKYTEAAALLEEVMAANHDESVLLRIRGYIAYETGDYQNALAYMKKFFTLHDPGKLIALDYIYFAKILLKTGDEILAIENYRKAVALEPARTDLFQEIARLAAKNRMHREAAQFYAKMIESGADRLNATFLIGKEYFFEGESWKARFDSLMELQNKNIIPFTDSLKVKENRRHFYLKADSAFTVVGRMSPDYAGGFIWKGRMQSLLDPEASSSGAKEAYEKALEILLKGDQTRNRKSIVECYKYLGSWYFLAYEKLYNTNKQESAEMRSRCMEYFTKIKELDPSDKQALDVLHKMSAIQK
ncbi:MAG TPA: tetratricopeptide repeat protein [Prolixibacteraceae bacterium]